jgi:hypothetical protein
MERNAITARDSLMGRIVNQIRQRGYYIADVDPSPEQAFIDLRWAARMAGRVLGYRTETHTSALGGRLPMKITIVVTPPLSYREQATGPNQVRSIIEDLRRRRVREDSPPRSA